MVGLAVKQVMESQGANTEVSFALKRPITTACTPSCQVCIIFLAINQNWGFTSFCKHLVYKNSQKSIWWETHSSIWADDRHDTASRLYHQLCNMATRVGGGGCSVTPLCVHTYTYHMLPPSNVIGKTCNVADINIFVDCKIIQQPLENFSSVYCVKVTSDEPLLPGKWNTMHTSCMYQHINVG